MNKSTLPIWPKKFFQWLSKESLQESIMGDLEEQFEEDVEKYGSSKAKRRFAWNVLLFCRPGIIRRLEGNQKLNNYGMFKHNLLITLRGFKKHKLPFFINLVGLSTGLASCILIYLWVNSERSMDTFHEKGDQLYWAMTHFKLPNETVTWNYTSGRLADAMKKDFPEVLDATRVGNSNHVPSGVITYDENHYRVEGLFAEENFFDVLTYSLIQGKSDHALVDKKSMVMSETLATRLFGSAQAAIGKGLEWENRFFTKKFVVSGVFRNVSKNDTKKFDVLVNYELLVEADRDADAWNGGYAETYLVLDKAVNIESFNQKISTYLLDKVGYNSENFTLFVQKYADNYLNDLYVDGKLVGGRIKYVRLFVLVSIFILIIACINFINLTTAQASRRMKEIGVKKSIGARKSTLFVQFLVSPSYSLYFRFLLLYYWPILAYLSSMN